MHKKYSMILLMIFLGILLTFATKPVCGPGAPAINNELPGVEGKAFTPDFSFAQVPLYFIPNQGQVHGDARFYARASRYTLWMTEKGLVFDAVDKRGDAPTRVVSRLLFCNAAAKPKMTALQPTGHTVNFIKGKNPDSRLTGLETSAAVLYKNLYNDIDLKVYGVEKKVEYDWIVKKGADPALIAFRYDSPNGARIDKAGNIIVDTGAGEMLHTRPVSYQIIAGKRVSVDVSFKKISKNTFGFDVKTYDADYDLVIDPVTLAYSTFIGGTVNERAYAMAVKGDGYAYITGETWGTDYPVTSGTFQTASAGGSSDAFVTKVSTNGSALVYSTYLGGSGRDTGEGIALDSQGKAYVTGRTSSTDFPVSGAFQSTSGGGFDAYLTCLSSSGATLQYSGYLGGSGEDIGYAIAVDSSNNAYISGRTASTDFPTHNAYQAANGGGDYDAFLTKFSSAGNSLVYSTYLGGSLRDEAFGVAVDGSGSAYISGRTAGNGFPTHNAYQAAHAGGTYDGFVTKFATTGASLIYSTFLGGSNDDVVWGNVVDSANNAYLTGVTYSTNFPTANAFQASHGGGDQDAFLTKLAANGTSLTFSTYLGGSEDDACSHCAVDEEGKVHVTGNTESSDFPVSNAYQENYSGDDDSFLTIFNSSGGSIYFSTFLGGSGYENGRGIALDGDGNSYIAGYTSSSDFPVANAYQNTIAGGDDVFVCKIESANLNTLGEAVENTQFTWTTSGSAEWYSQNEVYYNDYDSARSGAISGGQSATLSTTITGPGELSFYWYVDSEQGYDYLTFRVDNTNIQAISGTGGGWSQVTHTLAAGSHTLDWVYSKDGSVDIGNDAGFLDQVVFTPDSTFTLNRGQLNFGSVSGTTTTAEPVYVSTTPYVTVDWTAAGNQSWINVSPASGSGSGNFSISADTTGLSAGSYSGLVTVTDSGTALTRTVTVNLTIYTAGGTTAPFGQYATPNDGGTISSSVPFTGWVLDDIGIESVKLYRNDNGTLQYIGDALMVDGARPDVEAAYPQYPGNYKAGWGYMMLTNFLPNGNGVFEIHAIARDLEGNEKNLGHKTVTVDNANAVKPFGAIDTPAAGGIASGSSYRNSGWALTPMPNAIPTDGSTIDVYIDGVNIGSPIYNIYRPDIAQLFPGYANSNGAQAYLDFDTTVYEEGLHTIAWIVTDDASNADGIGSRFFTIQNASSDSVMSVSRRQAGATGVSSPPADLSRLMKADINADAPVRFSRGVARDQLRQTVRPDETGALNLQTRETERLEIVFNGEKGSGSSIIGGCVLAGNHYRPLPVGSTLDTQKGIFSWFPGAGFVGKYRLVFFEKDQSGDISKRIVTITILPKFSK